VIDLSDNEVRKLEGFPLLRRLNCLLLSNNRITRIAPNLGTNLPAIDTIILSGNGFTQLAELDPLASFSKLAVLSLLDNPVIKKPHYRHYLIHKLPRLRLLDFKKVKAQARKRPAPIRRPSFICDIRPRCSVRVC
jgi:U2 small nuclear ribonucleoprotein A'